MHESLLLEYPDGYQLPTLPILQVRRAVAHTIPRHVTLHTLTGSLVETCPVWSKERPVVEHLTLLEDRCAGRVVLQSHLHHSGILTHCVRGHQKQLQLDTGGKFWEQGAQMLLDSVSVEEKLPQVVL